eukprot:CAMPEP_0170382770 /NCGR_PEP_ID=MMETSP0117_2-20130122/15123_1 /TAXON_ID=400756 /ORGANISM="Durinskia baltica, Strain CSIRO CS-38" /LENGTH=730 /DNA_ID=CAMNT_0010638437 /DNA_START=45 /DNA_END=2234 /DNA_ORIENTATION=+
MQACPRMWGHYRPPGSIALMLSPLALLVAFTAPTLAAAVTPVQKVVELLNGMVVKGEEQKHQEQVAFSAFSEFCRHTEETKVAAIGEAEKSIVILQDTVAKAESDVDRLSLDIEALDGDLDGWAVEKAHATDVRKKERADYMESLSAYEESIDAIERAVRVLKARSADVKQAAANATQLLQSAVRSAPTASLSRRQLEEFSQVVQKSLLEVAEGGEEAGAPEANAYEFQSSGVVETLEKMRLKFQDEKQTLEKEEMNRRHAFELVMERFTDDIRNAEETRSRKAAQKGERQSELASQRGDLEETKAAKAADEKFLTDVRANCQTKSHEFEQRQKLRTEELAALAKAIEIISSPEVAGAAKKHLPAAALVQRAPAFLELRGSGNAVDVSALQARVAVSLAARAKSLKSAMLANLAEHAMKDPFAKVKQLIKDLLVRLLDEANEEADHKGWCDKEVSTNKQSRDELSTQVEELSAKVDEMSALEATLATEIKDLTEQIADLDASVAKATKERADEKSMNEATIAEAKSAQEAVLQATKVLQEFYARVGDATALLQGRARQEPVEPKTWDSPYQGLHGDSTGVVGMLDVIHSDFARLQAETEVAEGDAARRHNKFIEDSAVDRTVKDKEMRHKGYTRDSTLRILRETEKELEATQEELTDALRYYDKLKPACIDTGLSYQERVEKRQEEIESLKEALGSSAGKTCLDSAAGVAHAHVSSPTPALFACVLAKPA